MIEEAILYAAAVHRSQRRKGTAIPYIVHCVGAMRLALEYGYSEEIAAACVLHDTLEDTTVTYNDLLGLFGKQVADMVNEVTKPSRAQKLQWAEEWLPRLSPGAQVVKACDSLDNLQDLLRAYEQVGPAVFDRFIGGKERVCHYYVLVDQALQVRPDPLFTALQSALVQLLRIQ